MTTHPIKVYARDGLYVPMRHVTDEIKAEVKATFNRRMYDKEQTCENCDHYSERHSDICDACPNYKGEVKMASIQEVNDKQYLRLPYGARAQLQEIFGTCEIVDKTPERPMKVVPSFVGTLRPDQVLACKAMRKFKHGVLKSPPRTGKTVMGSYFVCKMGEKTLILAYQKDWLDNFYETFVGSDKQPAMTDIKKSRIGFPKTYEDFLKYDVCLVTSQMFISAKGKALLQKIKRLFGVLLIDEVQTVGAPEMASVVSQLVVRYKIGVSGTPERKDAKEFIFYNLLGPVFYENVVERLRPTVYVTPTAMSGKLPQSWTYMVSKLEKDPARLKLIAKQAIKDVKAGHMVLIPLTRVPVIDALAKAINILAGKKIAGVFHGQMHKDRRKKMIQLACEYRCKVLVGNTRLLSTGINIPRASMLYQVSPSANIPKAEQRFSRVLTPHEGKPRPGIRYFLDDVGVVRKCMQKEHWQCLVPTFRPMMTPEVAQVLKGYFANKGKGPGVNDYMGGQV